MYLELVTVDSLVSKVLAITAHEACMYVCVCACVSSHHDVDDSRGDDDDDPAPVAFFQALAA